MGGSDHIHGSRIIPRTLGHNAAGSFRPTSLGRPADDGGIDIETSEPGTTARLYWDLATNKLKVACEGVTHTIGP